MLAMDDELRQVLEAMGQENTAAHAETRRHLDIVAEDLGSLSERIDRLDAHIAQATENLDTRVTRLAERPDLIGFRYYDYGLVGSGFACLLLIKFQPSGRVPPPNHTEYILRYR